MSKETVEKRLELMIRKFTKRKAQVKGLHTLVKEMGLSSYTIQSMIDNNVIQKVGHGVYMPLLTEDKITDKLLMAVASRTTIIAKSSATKKKSPPRAVVVELNPLDKVSDDDLVEELKRRGYVGSLIKSYDITEPSIND